MDSHRAYLSWVLYVGLALLMSIGNAMNDDVPSSFLTGEAPSNDQYERTAQDGRALWPPIGTRHDSSSSWPLSSYDQRDLDLDKWMDLDRGRPHFDSQERDHDDHDVQLEPLGPAYVPSDDDSDQVSDDSTDIDGLEDAYRPFLDETAGYHQKRAKVSYESGQDRESDDSDIVTSSEESESEGEDKDEDSGCTIYHSSAELEDTDTDVDQDSGTGSSGTDATDQDGLEDLVDMTDVQADTILKLLFEPSLAELPQSAWAMLLLEGDPRLSQRRFVKLNGTLDHLQSLCIKHQSSASASSPTIPLTSVIDAVNSVNTDLALTYCSTIEINEAMPIESLRSHVLDLKNFLSQKQVHFVKMSRLRLFLNCSLSLLALTVLFRTYKALPNAMMISSFSAQLAICMSIVAAVVLLTPLYSSVVLSLLYFVLRSSSPVYFYSLCFLEYGIFWSSMPPLASFAIILLSLYLYQGINDFALHAIPMLVALTLIFKEILFFRGHPPSVRAHSSATQSKNAE